MLSSPLEGSRSLVWVCAAARANKNKGNGGKLHGLALIKAGKIGQWGLRAPHRACCHELGSLMYNMRLRHAGERKCILQSQDKGISGMLLSV